MGKINIVQVNVKPNETTFDQIFCGDVYRFADWIAVHYYIKVGSHTGVGLWNGVTYFPSTQSRIISCNATLTVEDAYA